MRRMLLLILALALPTAALASSIDFTTGTFLSGGITGFQPATFFAVSVFGSMAEIELSANELSAGCSGSAGTCTFTDGDVGILNAAGTLLFADGFENGTVTKTADTATITASLLPNSMAPSGGFVRFVIDFMPHHSNLTGGTAQIVAASEPGTLGMLGTGLIGLAGLTRRKLKLSSL